MNILRVEELESRDLLNGASFAPAIQQPMPYLVSPGASRFAEPATPAAFGIEPPTSDVPMMPNWTGSAAFADSRGPMMMSYDPIAVQPIETIVVVEWVILPAQPTQRDTEPPSEAAEPPGSVNVSAGNPRLPAPEAGASEPTSYSDAPTNRSTPTAAVAAAAVRTNAQSPFVIVPPANNPTFASETTPGSIASPILVRTPFRPGDGMLVASPGSLTPIAASSGADVTTPLAEETESAKPIEASPTPIGPGVLATLSTVDITALGRGLEQFLARIERAGEELIIEGDGLRPWLIAGAAAATACEIARRQLKRAAELAADGMPNALPDQPIVV